MPDYIRFQTMLLFWGKSYQFQIAYDIHIYLTLNIFENGRKWMGEKKDNQNACLSHA